MLKSGVTAVICSYNQGSFLGEAIESVIHQVQGIVLINNGSTDKTEAVIKHYTDRFYPFITSYHYPTNRGEAFGLQAGLNQVATKYCFFLDGDDYVDSSFVEKLLPKMKENKKTAIVYCDLALIGPRSRSKWYLYPGQWRREELNSLQIVFPAFSQSVKYELKKHNYIHGSALFNTHIAQSVEGVKEHNYFRPRHFLWYRIMDSGHAAQHVALPLLFSRQHSITQASWMWRIRDKKPLDSHIANPQYEQQILALQEELEILRNSPFYKTQMVLERLADNFKCDCAT